MPSYFLLVVTWYLFYFIQRASGSVNTLRYREGMKALCSQTVTCHTNPSEKICVLEIELVAMP